MHSFMCAQPFREGEEDGPQNHTCLQCAAKETAQDASPPVVVAIKENVENASTSTVTDLPPAKKMKLLEVATKQKRKVKDLPECLSSFSFRNKDWVTFGLEISPRDINLPQEEVVAKRVAQEITVPATEDGTKPTTFVLSDFTVDQLRKVAMKFGCVAIGSKSKFDVRMAMSIKTTVHHRICGTAVFQADEETCSRNTGIRMQNATFHAEHREQYIMSNDIKNAMREMLSVLKDFQVERRMRDTEEYEMLKADNERKKVAHEMLKADNERKKLAHEMLKADNERKKLAHEMMKEDNERKNVDRLAATSNNLSLPQFVRDAAKEQLEKYWIKKLGIMVEEAEENLKEK